MNNPTKQPVTTGKAKRKRIAPKKKSSGDELLDQAIQKFFPIKTKED